MYRKKENILSNEKKGMNELIAVLQDRMKLEPRCEILTDKTVVFSLFKREPLKT